MGGCCSSKNIKIKAKYKVSVMHTTVPRRDKTGIESQTSSQYKKLVQINAMNYMDSCNEKSVKSREYLLQIPPCEAILCLLDRIFSYYDFDDLEKMACVCRLFCYTATMDKLYSCRINSIDSEGESSNKEDERHKTSQKIKVQAMDNNEKKVIKKISSKEENWSKRGDGGSVMHHLSPNTSNSVLRTIKSGAITAFEHSPSIIDGKGTTRRKNNFSNFDTNGQRRFTINNLTEKEKDQLLKTVVFTENEVYSDSEHMNKCYKSIKTEEVRNPSSNRNSNTSKTKAGYQKGPKRRESQMVRLDVPKAQPHYSRRFTKVDASVIKKLITKKHHRPSVFIKNDLGSILEDIKESIGDEKESNSSISSSSESNSSDYISEDPKQPNHDKRMSAFPVYHKPNLV
ncbi:unnamed protein product [Moneuplotes crassus]|uniref:F-box domain-containing protein n=1 Tax=Euplotes crassus TaxID=5936 RepID=A0AAD1XW40_EUPCR|nr:unnamed protein product [Moneuplotes crassus]